MLVIPDRYGSLGPRRGVSNGGIAAGLIGAIVGGTFEVRLRGPVPVRVPLRVVRLDADRVHVRLDDRSIAEGRRADLDLTLPRVTLAEAQAASEAWTELREQHPGPQCFICGPRRSDGMRIFAGRLPPRNDGVIAAAPWTPAPGAADADGLVRPEIVAGALYCSAGATFWEPGLAPMGYRFRVRAGIPVAAGHPLVVVASLLEGRGPKRTTASAVQTTDGRVLATASVDWFVRPGTTLEVDVAS